MRPRKSGNSKFIKPQQFPSRSLPIHHSPIILLKASLYYLDGACQRLRRQSKIRYVPLKQSRCTVTAVNNRHFVIASTCQCTSDTQHMNNSIISVQFILGTALRYARYNIPKLVSLYTSQKVIAVYNSSYFSNIQ